MEKNFRCIKTKDGYIEVFPNTGIFIDSNKIIDLRLEIVWNDEHTEPIGWLINAKPTKEEASAVR